MADSGALCVCVSVHLSFRFYWHAIIVSSLSLSLSPSFPFPHMCSSLIPSDLSRFLSLSVLRLPCVPERGLLQLSLRQPAASLGEWGDMLERQMERQGVTGTEREKTER